MRLPQYIQDVDTWKSDFYFYTPIEIRFSETDMFGHMNNVSPFIYFEEARIKFFNAIQLFGTLNESNDKVPVVGDLQCDFFKQVYFGDELKLHVKVAEVGNSSVDIHYMGLNQRDELCITGRGKVVQINPQTGKSTPFESDQLKKLENGYKTLNK
ncbi:acyl-CoA thioesterase [Aquisalibacillus elongatus]|uniref:Acyl-CoA thioester hydrolase n=1 Tax=Aquisalibacillus elongatus TaxID=485577 RepID=A0A3N5C9Z8_9BACI|nr:thioesterase family protein [Aquisalibacillus elongatus]RPF55435.1 acyl-CoA thioester hydrolase [Aquisalibacillus elongatus]